MEIKICLKAKYKGKIFMQKAFQGTFSKVKKK